MTILKYYKSISSVLSYSLCCQISILLFMTKKIAHHLFFSSCCHFTVESLSRNRLYSFCEYASFLILWEQMRIEEQKHAHGAGVGTRAVPLVEPFRTPFWISLEVTGGLGGWAVCPEWHFLTPNQIAHALFTLCGSGCWMHPLSCKGHYSPSAPKRFQGKDNFVTQPLECVSLSRPSVHAPPLASPFLICVASLRWQLRAVSSGLYRWPRTPQAMFWQRAVKLTSPWSKV